MHTCILGYTCNAFIGLLTVTYQCLGLYTANNINFSEIDMRSASLENPTTFLNSC